MACSTVRGTRRRRAVVGGVVGATARWSARRPPPSSAPPSMAPSTGRGHRRGRAGAPRAVRCRGRRRRRRRPWPRRRGDGDEDEQRTTVCMEAFREDVRSLTSRADGRIGKQRGVVGQRAGRRARWGMAIERVIAPRRRQRRHVRRRSAAAVPRPADGRAVHLRRPHRTGGAGAGQGVDVPPHPHIGLATVTYLFDGTMVHRDSTGAVQTIEPGGVNWMTAGSGVAHSERTPDDARAGGLAAGRAADVGGAARRGRGGRRRRSSTPAPPTSRRSATAACRSACSSAPATASRRRCPGRRRCSTPTCTSSRAPGWRCRSSTRSGPCWSSTATSRSRVSASRPATSPSSGPATPSCAPTGAARVMTFGGAPVGRRHIWWNFVSSEPRPHRAGQGRLVRRPLRARSPAKAERVALHRSDV